MAPAKPSYTDLAYGSDPLQKLDLFAPTGVANAPIVVFVHGGGWSIGDKAQFGWVGEQLARDGFLVAVVNYRLSPAVQHPAHVQDVAKAVAWLAWNGPTYGGDPQRLHLTGHSAGAHLAALMALDPSYLRVEGYTPNLVRSVTGIAGAAYDLDAYYSSTPMASLLVPAFGKDTSLWAAAAPVRYVQPYAPPFLLAHGLNDTSAPASSTQTFAAALTRDGVPTQLTLLPNDDHYTILSTVLPSVRSFLQTGAANAARPGPAAAAGPRPQG